MRVGNGGNNMKRIIIIIGVVLAVSCSKSQESPKVDDSMVTWVFKAPSTKASLNASGAFSWSKGDQIAIWDATSGSFITFTTGSGSGRFSATAPASANFTTFATFTAVASEVLFCFFHTNFDTSVNCDTFTGFFRNQQWVDV